MADRYSRFNETRGFEVSPDDKDTSLKASIAKCKQVSLENIPVPTTEDETQNESLDLMEEGAASYTQASMNEPIPENNIGHKLLLKQGWQVGLGLGKLLQGRRDPIPIVVKEELMGFGRLEMELEQAEETTERRRILECEKGNTDQLQAKYKENQEKQKAKEDSLADLKKSFYCQLCEKQYFKHTDFDNHINSYDHAHKQRLKDLNKREFGRNIGLNRDKEERKLIKQMKKITEFADKRAGKDSKEDSGECDSPNGDASDIPLPVDPPPPMDKSPPAAGSSSPSSQGKMGVVSFSLTKKSTPKIPAVSVFGEKTKKPEVKEGKTDKVKNGEVKAEGEEEEMENEDNESSSDARSPEQDKEKCEDARDEFYHSAPPDHCKIKPQFSFLTFVKSTDVVNISEEGPGPGSGDKKETVNTTNQKDQNSDKTDGSGDGKQKLLDFVKVLSQDEVTELEWPAEMIQFTKTEPSIMFSCNPLSFDFTQLLMGSRPLQTVSGTSSEPTQGVNIKAEKADSVEKKQEAEKETITPTKKDKVPGQDETPAKTEAEELTVKSEKKSGEAESEHKKKHKKKKKKKAKHRSHGDKDAATEEQGKEKPKKKKKKKRKHKHKTSDKENEGTDGELEGKEVKTPTKKHKKKKAKKSKKAKHSESESESENGSEHENNEKPDAENSVEPTEKKPKHRSRKKKKSKKSKRSKRKHSDEGTDTETEEEAAAEKPAEEKEKEKPVIKTEKLEVEQTPEKPDKTEKAASNPSSTEKSKVKRKKKTKKAKYHKKVSSEEDTEDSDSDSSGEEAAKVEKPKKKKVPPATLR